MSDGFMLATRIPMTRDGFDRWLGTPAPGPSAIADPGTMFDGWFWDGRPADWSRAGAGVTPRAFFGGRVRGSCEGQPTMTVLLYRGGALEAYLFDLGHDEASVHTALLLFAAAGPFKSEPAEDAVLFWAETSGALGDPEWGGRLAVLLVGTDGARFTPACDLTAPVTALRPAEDRFYDLVGRMAEEEETHEGAFRSSVPLDPAFTDPALH